MNLHSCPHCGGVLTKGRSLPDHRRFFGLIAAAFEQWPEDHSFTPESAEHLRAWLTCKAGWRESTPIHMPDMATDRMKDLFRLSIEAAIAAAGGTAFVVPYRDVVAVIRPKSIAWDKIDQKEFGKLRDAVSDVIEAEIGVKADDLLREKAAEPTEARARI